MTYTKEMYGMPPNKVGENKDFCQTKHLPIGALAAACAAHTSQEACEAIVKGGYDACLKYHLKHPGKKYGRFSSKLRTLIGQGAKVKYANMTAEEKARHDNPLYEEISHEERARRAIPIVYPFHTPESAAALEEEIAARKALRAAGSGTLVTAATPGPVVAQLVTTPEVSSLDLGDGVQSVESDEAGDFSSLDLTVVDDDDSGFQGHEQDLIQADDYQHAADQSMTGHSQEVADHEAANDQSSIQDSQAGDHSDAIIQEQDTNAVPLTNTVVEDTYTFSLSPTTIDHSIDKDGIDGFVRVTHFGEDEIMFRNQVVSKLPRAMLENGNLDNPTWIHYRYLDEEEGDQLVTERWDLFQKLKLLRERRKAEAIKKHGRRIQWCATRPMKSFALSPRVAGDQAESVEEPKV